MWLESSRKDQSKTPLRPESDLTAYGPNDGDNVTSVDARAICVSCPALPGSAASHHVGGVRTAIFCAH